MNSLNQLAESIAIIQDKQLDFNYIEKLKFDIKSLRALFAKQDAERNLIDKQLIQTICIDLELVDMSICCDIQTDCKVLRSTTDIPKFVRLKQSTPFTFVGDLDGQTSYVSSNVEDWELESYKRFNPKAVLYDLVNNRLIIKNGNIRTKCLIKGIAENPEDLVDCSCDETNKVAYEADNYPLSLDMGTKIKDFILSKEARLDKGRDNEVKIDEEGVKK